MGVNLSERSWKRAWHDGYELLGNATGAVLGGLLVAVVGVIAALVGPVASGTGQAITGGIASVVALVVLLAAVYLVSLLRAPSKQRDEARAVIRDYLSTDLVLGQPYFSPGSSDLFVPMTNAGEPDKFIAQILNVVGLQGDEWLHPPWVLHWKGTDAEAFQIPHGAQAVLEIGKIVGPSFRAGLPVETRVNAGQVWFKPAGCESAHPLRSQQRQLTYDQALQEVFEIQLQVTGTTSMRIPAQAWVKVAFPSSRKSKWEGHEDDLDANITVELQQVADTAARVPQRAS